MPSWASSSFSSSTMVTLKRSMPRARDSTTSTSENLSTTSPGRKSASPKTRRQLLVSTTFFRYSQAFFSRMRKKSSLISASGSRVSIRTVSLERRFRKPWPSGQPFSPQTRTRPPSSAPGEISAISLS